jgi:hypothetical protein
MCSAHPATASCSGRRACPLASPGTPAASPTVEKLAKRQERFWATREQQARRERTLELLDAVIANPDLMDDLRHKPSADQRPATSQLFVDCRLWGTNLKLARSTPRGSSKE